MNNFLKKTFKSCMEMWDTMSKSTKESEVFFVPFGYLLVIGYLGFYYFNLFVAAPQGYESLTMRFMVAILGIGLILKKYWAHYVKVIIPVYWYFTLIFSLPFFFFFMLFNNPESNIWQINGLVGMVTLTFFVDWRAYIALTAIGTSLAYIAFCILHGVVAFPLSLLGVIGSYSAPIIYLVLFSYRRRQLYKDQLLAEEKAFNAKLMKQSSDLRKALSIKNEFLNNISHEVRTPISGVVNISELLVDNWPQYSEEERYSNMKVVARSGKRLLMLMNNILDLSKFESGKMSISIAPGNLEELIREMVAECSLLYLNNNQSITLELHIQPNLDSNIDMDHERITQVMRNLIGNAIKFTTNGKVKIFLQKQGNYLEVIVRDEGVGVPENELEDIFSSFVQSSRTKNKAGGTGLGLAICKETILAHHGRIWAQNNQSKGSAFHFLLPKPPLALGRQAKQAQGIVDTILVIEDDSTCHTVLSLILKSEGYEIISVYGGMEGLEYLKSKEINKINAVFLDLMMPDMYGMNVLKEIKSNASLSHIPVVIQSASHDINERTKAMELGAASFLKKPYDRKEIAIILKAYRRKLNS